MTARNSFHPTMKFLFVLFLNHVRDRMTEDIARHSSFLSLFLFLSLCLSFSRYIKLSNSPSVAHVASIRAICARILTVWLDRSNLFMPIPKSRAQDVWAHRQDPTSSIAQYGGSERRGRSEDRVRWMRDSRATRTHDPRHLKSKWDLIRILKISNARKSRMHRVVYSKRSWSFRIPHTSPLRAKPVRFRIGAADCIASETWSDESSCTIRIVLLSKIDFYIAKAGNETYFEHLDDRQ